MKAASLIFLTMSWAAWMPGTGYAAASNHASQQTSPQAAANTANDHPRDAARTAQADKSLAPRKRGFVAPPLVAEKHPNPNAPRTQTRATHPKHVLNTGKRSTSGNATNLHQPGLAKSDGAANNGSVRNETGNNPRPVRSASVTRSAAPPLNNVRHRGSNPAAIGGSASANGRNAAALDGARMHRKP